MIRSGQPISKKQFVLNLLGINQQSSQLEPTKTQRIADILCLIGVCLGAGYLVSMQGFDSLPLNADSLAPFEEAKSLIDTPGTHLFNIHVSRIPSIFPDLAINTLLQIVRPEAGFLEIFSLYSWFTSFLYLALATLLIDEIGPRKQTFTANAIKISLVTITLLNISHQFNIAYAHIITPVHHGGNVLNTLLLLTLSLRLIQNPKQRGLRITFASLIVLAALSNKLAIFTAALPAAFIFLVHLRGKTRRDHLLQLIIATSSGLFIGSLLNEQCASAAFNLSNTFISFKQYFQLSWITLASAFLSIASLIYCYKARSGLAKATSAGLTAISLSSLSYFLYLPILTGRGQAPLRYICIAYLLIVIFIVFYISRANTKNQATGLIAMIVITIISFQSPVGPFLDLTTHQSLKQDLIDRSERIDRFKYDAAEFIHMMGYDSYLGLGEYWMTGATLISNSKIRLIPILKDGKPDFWGATPQDIRKQIKPIKSDKAYVLSNDDSFIEKLESQYGLPTKTWNYDNKTREFTQEEIDTSNRLLIYNNKVIFNRISKKAKHFKRQCNKSLPNYRKR